MYHYYYGKRSLNILDHYTCLFYYYYIFFSFLLDCVNFANFSQICVIVMNPDVF